MKFLAVIIGWKRQSADEQQALNDVLSSGYYRLDMKKAEILRVSSEKKPLTADDIEKILSGKKKEKSSRPLAFKLNPKLVSQYFRPEQKVDEIGRNQKSRLTTNLERNSLYVIEKQSQARSGCFYFKVTSEAGEGYMNYIKIDDEADAFI